jgi:hypothetical protein
VTPLLLLLLAPELQELLLHYYLKQWCCFVWCWMVVAMQGGRVSSALLAAPAPA